jgi:hypothetical protein
VKEYSSTNELKNKLSKVEIGGVGIDFIEQLVIECG